jgi:glycosyltransferase involved in cell wall biosynthesis
MMRVAYVNADPGVPAFGTKGSSIHVQEVLRAMLATGADVELFTRRVDNSPPPDLTGVALHVLPPLPRDNPAAREQAAVAANPEVMRLLSLGAFDLIYERYSLWSDAGMQFAHSHGIPGVLEVNAPLIEEQSHYRDLIDRTLAEAVARRSFFAAKLICAVSDGVAAYVRRFPEANGKVVVVPNAVDPRRFLHRPAAALPAPDGVFTIGFVGTLKPWHGLDVLAEAFQVFHASHPMSRLLIVGDGPERTRLEKQLHGAMVTFAGAVAPDRIPAFLASMDVAVAPYPKLEPFYFSPLKLYEYMAAGLPVVASCIGQIEKVIDHAVTGWLVEPGNPKALAEALTTLVHDLDLRQRLGQAARAAVCQRHTWDTAIRRIFDLAFSGMKSPHTVERY